jgi:type VI secretion system protein ImpE
MQALKLINEGKLDEAIESATESVRNSPTDTGGREILSELFCLRGELDRADKQCETIMLQQPQAALRSSLLRQLIRAETARRECWQQGRVPEFIGEPDESCTATLKALISLRSGLPQEASDELAELHDRLSTRSGNCNGKAFEGFRDLDDCCLGIFEVLTSTGKYFWIPTSRINGIIFDAVSRPRDLLWRQCQMSVDEGPDGVVYVPAIYVQTDASCTIEERLGRATNWIEADGEPVRGIGQRSFLVGDDELGIMDIETLTFDSAN